MFRKKHIRLEKYDYSSPNSYYITICTKNKQKFLGQIRNGIVGLSEIGNNAAVYLQKIPEIRPHIILDEFIVMPDHIHCILIIKNSLSTIKQYNEFGKPVPNSISIIINRYKGAVKNWCNNNGHEYFQWQDNFYEHIIRNSEDYWTIKNYIINNPITWWKKTQ